MFSLKINNSQLTNFINKLQKAADNFSLVGTESEVKPIIAKAITEQIASQGARSREPWQPLADGSGRTPLNRSGALISTAKNPSVSVEGNKYLVTFSGPGEKQLALHNKGFTVNRKLKKGGSKKYKVPKRKVVALNAEDVQEIRKIVVRQFKKSLLG